MLRCEDLYLHVQILKYRDATPTFRRGDGASAIDNILMSPDIAFRFFEPWIHFPEENGHAIISVEGDFSWKAADFYTFSGFDIPMKGVNYDLWNDTERDWKDAVDSEDIDVMWERWSRDYLRCVNGAAQCDRIPCVDVKFQKGKFNYHETLARRDLVLDDFAKQDVENKKNTATSRWKSSLKPPTQGAYCGNWFRFVSVWVKGSGSPAPLYLS